MVEVWWADDGTEVRAENVERVLRPGPMATLTSSLGRILMFVTNGERAMVVLLEQEGDAGQHLVDPGSTGISGGYVLDNGQADEYPNSDTVALQKAWDTVRDLIEGSGSANEAWASDR